jgi:hypothetical protein
VGSSITQSSRAGCRGTRRTTDKAEDGERQVIAGFITIVSGYPRSGTSLMMQMLEAGGMQVLVGENDRRDEYNPKGYYEFKPAFRLGDKGETPDWLTDARGKAAKVIAPHLCYLPIEFNYRIVFMRRKIKEVLASWRQIYSGGMREELSEREQILAFKTEYVLYEIWLDRQPNIRALYLSYNDILAAPEHEMEKVRAFLGVPLDLTKMVAAIDPTLYRHRV